MCGIAGIITHRSELLTAHRIQKMTDALAHRGPDGHQYWINEPGTTGFGHRRLAIIDLSPAAAQPMHYRNRYTIVYNGEIYNYIELRESLEKKGYRFNTRSDTEVILAAFDCYQTGCPQYFDGMFAFAIWDQQEQTLFAARDRFGEKPFFYYINNDQFVFASEMKALWAAGIEKQFNEKMLFNYFTLGYTQNPANAEETFYTGIQKLPARSFITYHFPQHALTRSFYWNIEPGAIEENITEAGAIKQFNVLFEQSVCRRLRSDVPVGTSLSGGLDSSSVLACIHAQKPLQYKTFSATFPGFEKDESSYIHIVSNRFQTSNCQVQPNAQQLIDDLEKICYHQEEPFQSSSIAVQYEVYKLAQQQQVKVVLDGQGADEILAGYNKYYPWYWQQLFRQNKSLLAHEINSARSLGITAPWGIKHKLAAVFPAQAAHYQRRFRKYKQLLQNDLSASFIHAYGQSYYDSLYFYDLNSILYYNTCVNGLEELLRYADRNSMAHGVEVRLPFLSHELVQFLFTLPAHLKIHNGYTKWLLRKSMENKLPDAIVWRTDKVGFEPPQQQWMNNEHVQQYIHESKKMLVKKGILNKAALQKKIQPREAHAAENYDWRYLVAGCLFK